jgi:hypothetical protein
VDEVGQQEHVEAGGELAGHGVAGDDGDPVPKPDNHRRPPTSLDGLPPMAVLVNNARGNYT